MSHDVKSVAIATTRASRTILATRLSTVHADLDDCIDRDGSDKRFFRLLGWRDSLVNELHYSERFEQSVESARPEALALLTQPARSGQLFSDYCGK
jgi:hypothetical protein